MTAAPPAAVAPASRRGPSAALVWVALLIVYVVWGSTYIGIRVTVESIPPFLSAGVRFVAAGALMLAFLTVRRGWAAVRPTPRQLAAAVLVGALLLVGGNGLLVYAEQTVPAGLAALIIALVPLWIVLLRAAGGDRPPLATYAGVALGVVGVAVLALPGERPGDASTLGLVLCVLASLSWAVGSSISGRAGLPSDPFVGSAYEMLAGGAMLTAIGLASGEGGDLDLGAVSLRSAAGLAYLVVFGSLVAFSAYVWLLQNAPISRVSTYAYVNPAVAIALGALLLDEAITASIIAGGALIVGAVALVVSRERVRSSPA